MYVNVCVGHTGLKRVPDLDLETQVAVICPTEKSSSGPLEE